MKLILYHQVIKVVNQDVYVYGIILYGVGQGTLQIQQKPETGRAKTLWTKTNDQGKYSCFSSNLLVYLMIYFR